MYAHFYWRISKPFHSWLEAVILPATCIVQICSLGVLPLFKCDDSTPVVLGASKGILRCLYYLVSNNSNIPRLLESIFSKSL